jgi:hypothetical protein
MRHAVALVAALTLGLLASGCQPLAPPPPTQPTIVVYGDSFVEEARNILVTQLARPGWTVSTQSYAGTALCDWLPRMRTAQATIVILAFQGLTLTPCAQGRGDALHVYLTDGEIAARVWHRPGTKVLWVSPPGTVGTRGTSPLASLYQNLAGEHRGSYVDAAKTLQAPDGSWPLRLPCLPSEHRAQGCVGGTIQVRTSPTNGHLCDVPNISPCPVYSSGETRWVGAIAAAVVAL